MKGIPIKNETKEERRSRLNAYVQKWRKENPEKQRLARKRASANKRLKALKIVGEPRCRRCGCDVVEYLEFNHINGGGSKEWRDNNGMQIATMLLTKRRGTEGLEILCRVCNAIEFLERKKKGANERYNVRWEKLTGKKGIKIE